MYGFNVTVEGDFDDVVSRVIEELKAEGFGVLTEIDVKETLKAKLGVDRLPYRILGACNPPLAHKAIEAEPDIGLLLPCNVTVEADGSAASIVRIANPELILSVGSLEEDPELSAVAQEARQRLERVAEFLLAS